MQIFNILSVLRYCAYCIITSFHSAPTFKRILRQWNNFVSNQDPDMSQRLTFLCLHNICQGSPQPPCCASWRCPRSQTSPAGRELSAAVWTAACKWKCQKLSEIRGRRWGRMRNQETCVWGSLGGRSYHCSFVLKLYCKCFVQGKPGVRSMGLGLSIRNICHTRFWNLI